MTGRWLYLGSQVFNILTALLNAALAVNSFLQSDYWFAAFNGSLALLLLGLLIYTSRNWRRHQRVFQRVAADELKACLRYGICPDCGAFEFDRETLACQTWGLPLAFPY
jgi:hypothetical protein